MKAFRSTAAWLLSAKLAQKTVSKPCITSCNQLRRVSLSESRRATFRLAGAEYKCCGSTSVLVLQNKLGGGEGIEGLYGSLTRTGMQKVLHSLSKSCGLDKSSRLVDVGAGLGRYANNAEQMCMHKCSPLSLSAMNRVLHTASAKD